MSSNHKQTNQNMSDFYKRMEKRKKSAQKAPVPTKKTSAKHKSKASKPVKKQKKAVYDKQKINTLISLGAVLAAALILMFFLQKNAVEVYVGEEIAGIVKAKELKNIKEADILTTVKTQIETELNTGVSLSDAISFKQVHSSKTVSYEYILPKIRSIINYKIKGAAFTVDDVLIATVKSQAEANEILDEMAAPYITEGATDVKKEFVNAVITDKLVDANEITAKEKAASLLSATTKTTGPYTVQSGDTLLNIALKHQMTMESILEANPDITDPGRIRPGQAINVVTQKPLVSIKVTETIKRTEKIPKTVEERTDDTQYTTYNKVLQPGTDGEKEVTVTQVKIDGIVQSSSDDSEKILKDPETEIVVVGTKVR